MENGYLTRRSLLKTAALATTALAVPFVRGADDSHDRHQRRKPGASPMEARYCHAQ